MVPSSPEGAHHSQVRLRLLEPMPCFKPGGVHYFKPTKRKLLFYWPAIEEWIREEHHG